MIKINIKFIAKVDFVTPKDRSWNMVEKSRDRKP